MVSKVFLVHFKISFFDRQMLFTQTTNCGYKWCFGVLLLPSWDKLLNSKCLKLSKVLFKKKLKSHIQS